MYTARSSCPEQGQATYAHDAPGQKKSKLESNMHETSFSRGKANQKHRSHLRGRFCDYKYWDN